MDLSHRFTVPTDVETTWAHFQDIAALAQCFPGAQVTSAEGSTFQGTCKVKLGPIALVYTGSGTFVEKDDDAHRFVVDAKGKDKRGNGTAGAKVTLSMGTAASGGTDVSVLTDLAVTGKPAQYPSDQDARKGATRPASTARSRRSRRAVRPRRAASLSAGRPPPCP